MLNSCLFFPVNAFEFAEFCLIFPVEGFQFAEFCLIFPVEGIQFAEFCLIFPVEGIQFAEFCLIFTVVGIQFAEFCLISPVKDFQFAKYADKATQVIVLLPLPIIAIPSLSSITIPSQFPERISSPPRQRQTCTPPPLAADPNVSSTSSGCVLYEGDNLLNGPIKIMPCKI